VRWRHESRLARRALLADAGREKLTPSRPSLSIFPSIPRWEVSEIDRKRSVGNSWEVTCALICRQPGRSPLYFHRTCFPLSWASPSDKNRDGEASLFSSSVTSNPLLYIRQFRCPSRSQSSKISSSQIQAGSRGSGCISFYSREQQARARQPSSFGC
jgi:hypothetical protein